MVWFRVDDSLPDHPKLLALQERKAWQGALSLWTLAGAWCGKHLTNGHVPRAVVARLGCTLKDADALVDAGFWERTKDGFQFHDWQSRNPTKAQVETDREKTRARVAKHRGNAPGSSARNSVGNDGGNGVTNGAPVPSLPDLEKRGSDPPSLDGGASHALTPLPTTAERAKLQAGIAASLPEDETVPRSAPRPLRLLRVFERVVHDRRKLVTTPQVERALRQLDAVLDEWGGADPEAFFERVLVAYAAQKRDAGKVAELPYFAADFATCAERVSRGTRAAAPAAGYHTLLPDPPADDATPKAGAR